MIKLPVRPNTSRLLESQGNRVTGEEAWHVRLTLLDRAIIVGQTERLKSLRATCGRERQEWLEIKKSGAGKYAKPFEREWLQRDRACNPLIKLEDGNKKEDWDQYYWPVELAPSIEWVISNIIE